MGSGAPPTCLRWDRAASEVPMSSSGSVPQPLSLILVPGAQPLPGYELLVRLGHGGFGEVWKARGPGGIEQALKFLPLEGEASQVELHALEAVKNVRHPHLL